MNLKAHKAGFVIWSEAQADIDPHPDDLARVPADFGTGPICSATSNDATRCMHRYARGFVTYDVKLTGAASAYCARIMALPAMAEWIAAGQGRTGGGARTRLRVLMRRR